MVAALLVLSSCTDPTEVSEPAGTPSSEASTTTSPVTGGPNPAIRLGTPETAGEWVLDAMVTSVSTVLGAESWRPTLSIRVGELWEGDDGCNAFGLVERDGTVGMWTNQALCPGLMAQSRQALLVITDAVEIVRDGNRLVVLSSVGRLTYVPRDHVPLSAPELSHELLVNPADYGGDPSGSGLIGGLRSPDASCPAIWESAWPGPAEVDGQQVVGPLLKPTMALFQRVVVLEPGAAASRAAEAERLLDACRADGSGDEWEPLDVPVGSEWNIVTSARATRTHDFDPQGRPSDTPMKRTTNVVVAISDGAVLVLVGVQSRTTPVDRRFEAFVLEATRHVTQVLETAR